MQNKLMARVMGNKLASKIIGEVSRFYIQNESAILTTGTIGFSMATTAVTYRNAVRINDILVNARIALNNCNTKEEKNAVYRLMLKELAPLVLPILIFQSATIGCAVFAKKQSDKRLAEAAGALSIAQQAIAYYQTFQKEAEQSLGEEKYKSLQDDIYRGQEFDGRRFTNIASEGAPGEVLIIDKYSGRPFWSSFTRVVDAVERTSYRLSDKGGFELQTLSDIYDSIANPDLTPNELSDRFGYVEGETISVNFSDTHYIFPNGTRIQAAVMNLYPEPELVM